MATATLRDASGNPLAGRAVTWVSSAPTVATVTETGLVTAVAPGTATITATSEGKRGDAVLTVTAPTVAVVAVSLASNLLALGQTTMATATLHDATGNQLPGRPVTWTSGNGAVATVSAVGLVTAVAAGMAAVTATSDGISGSATVTVVAHLATGQVVVAGDASPAGTSVTLRTRGLNPQDYVGLVDATGGFRIPLPQLTDSLDLTVDAASGTRAFRPVVQRISVSAVARPIKPLLVPREVVLTTGSYGGATVGVSLADAFTPVCANETDANCNSFFPNYWPTIGVVLWSEAELPVPVAFNRQESTEAISAADSIAVWATLQQMESDAGRRLFRPVNFSDVAPPYSGFSPHAILLSVDAALTGSGGYANWAWGSDLNMLTAKVRMSSAAGLTNRSLLTHEMLHALGFHHTCRWATVMGGYGCPLAPQSSSSDIAGLTLGYAVRRAVLAEVPTSGLLEALQGERTIELGLPPVSVLADIVAPGTVRRRMQLFGTAVFVEGAP